MSYEEPKKAEEIEVLDASTLQLELISRFLKLPREDIGAEQAFLWIDQYAKKFRELIQENPELYSQCQKGNNDFFEVFEEALYKKERPDQSTRT